MWSYSECVLDGRVFTAPLLTDEQCKDIVDAAEAYAGRNGGWAVNRRHKDVPTTDFELQTLQKSSGATHPLTGGLDWVSLWQRDILGGCLKKSFNVDPTRLYPQDVFIARYEADGEGQPSLPWHKDGSVLSYIAALNDPAEYEGGGTQFVSEEGPKVRMARGEVCFFLGQTLHCGIAVTKGVRYIMAGFLDLIVPRGVAVRCKGGVEGIDALLPQMRRLELQLRSEFDPTCIDDAVLAVQATQEGKEGTEKEEEEKEQEEKEEEGDEGDLVRLFHHVYRWPPGEQAAEADRRPIEACIEAESGLRLREQWQVPPS